MAHIIQLRHDSRMGFGRSSIRVNYNMQIIRLMIRIVHSQIGIGVAHDGGHGSYSKNPIANRLAALAMDFMGGSSVVWAHQHNIGIM